MLTKYKWVNINQLKMVDISLASTLEVLKVLKLISDEVLGNALSCETLLLGLENEEE